MHIISLTFDDGFLASSTRTAEIFEEFGLPACFSVIATGHEPTFVPPDEYHFYPRGGFDLWNDLASRGHEVHPHGYAHERLPSLGLLDAQDSIQKCLDTFGECLDNFDASQAVFAFPYNVGTPALVSWLRGRVRAVRVGGSGINIFPNPYLFRLRATTFGPGNCEIHLEAAIAHLLSLPRGWLIYNLHGLDGEGWGPCSSDFLRKLIESLLPVHSVRLLPVGKALDLPKSYEKAENEQLALK